MARIYRTTDRIKVRLDDVTVTVSPLEVGQKAEIQEAMLGFTRGDVKSAARGVFLAIKYAVKGIEGVEDFSGEPYALEFEGGVLTDQCVHDLFNLEAKDKLALVCSSFAHGVPKDLDGHDGVELIETADAKKK